MSNITVNMTCICGCNHPDGAGGRCEYNLKAQPFRMCSNYPECRCVEVNAYDALCEGCWLLTK